ncbi:MAG: PilN domain-containing protein [Rhodanobacteraceae bacterium]
MFNNEALDRQWARVRMRLAKSPLPGFFAWWGRELLACLPPRWRAIVLERSESLLLDIEQGDLVVWRERGDVAREYGRIRVDLPAEAQRAEFQRLRERIEDPAVSTILCIANERVLQRNLSLPAAAEDNLRQVLAFEMDRQTPFKADQVYFDSRVRGREANGRNVQVDLVLLPRAQLDAELAKLAGGTLALDGVDSWRGAPGEGRCHVNLLPQEKRARRRNLRLPLNLGLAALAAVLLVFNMHESLVNRVAAIASMQGEVTKAKAEAKQVVALKKTLVDSIAGANFLTDKKRQGPLMVAILDDLTKRLPQDAYLERLNIQDKQVQLQGQAKEAAKLIGLLGSSQYLANPRFEGQIQPDPRTDKERFQITADLKAPDVQPSPVESAAPGKSPASKTPVRKPPRASEGVHGP